MTEMTTARASSPVGSSGPACPVSESVASFYYRFGVTLLIGLAVVCVSRPAWTQDDLSGGDLSDIVYVRLGLVDVVVTDGKGRALRDLVGEDFELRVDGREVEITHFEAPTLGAAPDATPKTKPDPRDETEVAPSQTGELPTAFLYFDDLNTPPDLRARVQGDLIDSLAEAGVDRRVVVVQRLGLLSFSQRLEGADQVRAHVESLATPNARSLITSRARERATTQLARSHEDCLMQAGCEPCQTNWRELLDTASQYATDEQSRTADAVSALAEIAAVAAGVEGQKILLWVSAGISHRPGIEAFDYIGDLCESFRDDARSAVMREILLYDETPRLERLATHANARRVTIVALDAAGLRAGLSSSVSFASVAVRPTMNNDTVFAANLQSALGLVARETGGSAITNANQPREALAGTLAQVADGYVLGFSLDGPPSGREHLITVRLRGNRARNAQVRYRRSLQDNVVEQTLLDRLAATLYLGEEENGLGASVSAGEGTRIGRRFREVPIEVTVPKEMLSNLAGESARVRVWLTATSESGWRSKTRQEIFDLGEEPGELLRVTVRMELPDQPVRVAVGIREEATGATSRLLLELPPGEGG